MARKYRLQSIRLCGLAMMLVAGPVLALGLGNIQVRSHLDEPFSAVIPLSVDSPSDLDGLSVSLGSAAAFRQAGIETTDALSTLHFTVDTQAGRSVVIVKSDKPIREPYLNFLVQAQWSGGTLLREYTVLMNPPDLNAGASPAPSAHVVASGPVPAAAPPEIEHRHPVQPRSQVKSTPQIRPSPRPAARPKPVAKLKPVPRPKPSPIIPSSSSASTSATQAPSGSKIAVGSRYGPVKSQETFWSIAKRLRPDVGVTMDQVLLSIYDANREAFYLGHFNGLMKGSMLDIPSAASMRATSAADAKARILALRNGHVSRAPAMRKRPTATAPPTAAASAPAELAQQNSGPESEKSQSQGEGQIKSATTSSSNQGSAAQASPSNTSVAASTTGMAPQSAQAASQSAPAGAAPPIANPAPASSVATTVVAPAAMSSASPPAVPASASKPAVSVAPKAPVGNVAPTPMKTAAAAHSPALRQSNFFQRWRLPLLGILALLILLALLLRSRRKPADDDDERRALPVRPPIGTTRDVSQASQYVAVPDREHKSVGSAAGGAGVTAGVAAAGVAAAVAAEGLPSAQSSHGRAAMREDDGSFDRTAQGGAKTLDMGMDSGDDPLAEADFHLAYGLYDEAIQLLKNALVQSPKRMDLKLKLEECYAVADKPLEYQELAEELQSATTSEQWRQIAEEGRRLCPGVALFELPGQAASMPIDKPAAVEPVPIIDPVSRQPEPQQTPGDNVIDFDPPSMQTTAKPSPPPVIAKPTSVVASKVQEEAPDLGDFDSFGTRASSAGDSRIDFNLGALDLSAPDEAGIRPDWPKRAEPMATDDSNISDDEFTTKLDLARAYADMGDNEAARSLLDEVVQGGSAALKNEAEALARKLAD